MMNYFKDQQTDMEQHAKDEWPNESVGVIVNDAYMPLKNVSKAPHETFTIDPKGWIGAKKEGDIQAVVHSHNNYRHASVADQTQQLKLGIPFVIVNLINKSVESVFSWGDTLPIPDLIGRSFHQGAYDCYSIVRDYYRLHGIVLFNVPREYRFWDSDSNVITNNEHQAPFYEIDKRYATKHDVIVYGEHRGKADHLSVIGDNYQVYHHFEGRLSSRMTMEVDKSRIVKVLRYKGEINDIPL